MTISTIKPPAESTDQPFALAADDERIDRTARAVAARGFSVEVLDDAQTARARVAALVPSGASVFTATSVTLSESGIEADLNQSGHHDAIKPRVLALDRATHGAEIRQLIATPDIVIGSASAVTEDGTLVAVSAQWQPVARVFGRRGPTRAPHRSAMPNQFRDEPPCSCSVRRSASSQLLLHSSIPRPSGMSHRDGAAAS